MTFINVDVTQTPSGDGTTTIDLSYSFQADTYYSNNGTASGEYVSDKDGIFDATLTTEPSGAIITGLIPGSIWVVHVDGPDGSGGTQEIKVEGVPAKPVNNSNCTVTGYLNRINFDFSTNSTIWNYGVPSNAKVIIKSLNNATTFDVCNIDLSANKKSFDISAGLKQLTNYELKVQLTSTIGAGPVSDSFVVRTDNQRAAVTITSAIGVQSLEKDLNASYVDICFNVGPGPNAAAEGDIIRYALDGCANLLLDTSGEVKADASGNYGVTLTSTDLTGGDHTIKLLIQAKGTTDVPLITDGNASNPANFNIKFKPDDPSFNVPPENATNNAITFSFDTDGNNGWSPSYKAVVTASGDAATASNEIVLTSDQVSSGSVTLTEGQLTGLPGVALNSDLEIHIKKTVSGLVNDGTTTTLDLSNTNVDLFYIVDPEFNSCSVTESDDPSQNYLHIDYDISGDAVLAESVLKAYIRYDQSWNATNPTVSGESPPITLGTQLVGVDVAIDSGASDGSNVYVLLELNNEGKKAYKTASLTLKDKEPEPELDELFGWSDYPASTETNAIFDFEFNKPTDGILADLRFEVWLKDLSSGVFNQVASYIKATKLRAGGVTIRASIDKNFIVDASGFTPNDLSYDNKTDLSFGVAQTNPNYILTSSDFTTGFTNNNGTGNQTVVQTVVPVKYHPVDVNIISVTVGPSNTLKVNVVGTNLKNKASFIEVFDSSANDYISLNSAKTSGTFLENNGEILTVTTTNPISTTSEYRLVLQVKENGNVLSQDTQVFTYAFAPLIDTTAITAQTAKVSGLTVDASLNSSNTADVSGYYAVSINPNGAALTTLNAMYYSDISTDFVKVDVPVKTPPDELNGTYTAYIDFTNMEGAILMAANDIGLDAHHFSAPQ